MTIQQFILLPFSGLYRFIMKVRNYFYDRGLFYSARFDRPVISVGNLTVGGTGKTPMVEYLVRLLKKDHQVATLSRGYGRKTRGFRLAGAQDNALTIGDEPYQYYLKFQPEVLVSVGEKRMLAIPQIIYQNEGVDVILLDDAYQHRSVTPDLNILLTDFNRPFYQDFVMPSGRLRESRSGAGRADVVVVTKCPDQLGEAERIAIEAAVKPYTKENVPVLFTGIQYARPVPVPGTKAAEFSGDVFLVSGIANPKPLESYIKKEFKLVEHMVFADHYVYTPADLGKIREAFHHLAAENKVILVTEKDMARLLNDDLKPLIADLPIFYLPISVKFLEGQEVFDQRVLETILLKKREER